MMGFDKFFENKTLLYSAGAAAFLVAALLILFIFRLAFGRRLHMPGGGRARQARLGIVDAFDLDRQRQLVLLRRDNVEHLIMIGGPNDVLIESQIVRAEARDLQRPREKEPAVAPLSWPAGGAAALGQAPVIPSEPKLPPIEEPAIAAKDFVSVKDSPAKDLAPVLVPAPPPAPAPVAVAPSAPAIATPPPASAPTRPPFLPLPPRRPITTPSFNFKLGAAAPSAPLPGATAEGGQPLNPPASPSPLKPPGPASFVRPPRPIPASGTVAPPVTPVRPADPTPADTAPSIAPEVVAPQPHDAEADKAAKQIDALESLEEEMAKLLGRPGKDG